MNLVLKIISFTTFFFLSNFITKIAQADIVVIAYDNFSSESFNLEIIDKHIKLLIDKKYYVLTTSSIIEAAAVSQVLPNYSIAITITSNDKQIINNIWPSLARASLPFTLFIDPHLINNNNNMSWKELSI